MGVITFTPPAPRGRANLVTYLRDLADLIETGEAETDPRAALIVLTGPDCYEVLHVGNEAEPGFLPGAVRAIHAVYDPSYTTMGGNVRLRTRYAADLHSGEAGSKDVIHLRRKDP